MSRLSTIAFAAIATFVSASAADEPANVVALAENVSELSTLVSFIKKAGLVDTLSKPTPELTVFAPTNAAFSKVPKDVVDYLEKNVTALTKVLEYHVLGKEVLSKNIPSKPASEKTLESQNVEVVKNTTGAFVNDAKVVTPDNMAKNGVAHIIDAVLLPPGFSIPATEPANVVALAENVSELSTLVSFIKKAGLVDTLSKPTPELTVFAPTNAAFSKVPKDVVDYLEKNVTALTKVLEYHVLGKEVLSKNIPSKPASEKTLEGQNVEVVKNTTGAFVNDAKVVTPDNMAKNGVAHIIDAVLVPEGVLPANLTPSTPSPPPSSASSVMTSIAALALLLNVLA